MILLKIKVFNEPQNFVCASGCFTRSPSFVSLAQGYAIFYQAFGIQGVTIHCHLDKIQNYIPLNTISTRIIQGGIQLQDVVRSRISIKWSTPLTLMATVQTQQIGEERWR
jgi:hypothetical protein